MSQHDTIIHLIAGGVGGTAGAIVTCPLEVVKTRLQSSSAGFYSPSMHNGEIPPGQATYKSFPSSQQRRRLCTGELRRYNLVALTHCDAAPPPTGGPQSMSKSPSIRQCLKYIVKNEGYRALFKGLVPNLIGVAPSRAIYFCTYAETKNFFNTCLPPNSPLVHMSSATCAGFVSCTATNPIWFVKTRLQLDNRSTQLSALECIKKIYQQKGLIGFYKGIVASYVGISETVIHFVIYEATKTWLITHRSKRLQPLDSNDHSKSIRDFIEFMASGAFSKTVASCIAYPHEVVRTRLREEGTKYTKFWQTTKTITSEEGIRGLYRGLLTQLIRQIPNTAIVMVTYEAMVYLLTQHLEKLTNPGRNTTQFYTETKSKELT